MAFPRLANIWYQQPGIFLTKLVAYSCILHQVKAIEEAVDGWIAIEQSLIANAEMHGCMTAPLCIVLVMLGGKLNKGFWASGKFLHTKLEFRLSEIFENSIPAVLC
jgi:hypothetical protein